MTTDPIQLLPADYFVTTHQFTKAVHRDQYPSIDPASPKLSQKGKTVIVTGASQGIGKAIALAFAKADAARIVLASRSGQKLGATKQELLKINRNLDVLVLPTDTTSEESVNHLEETVKSKFGIPDVLVNGAGIWAGGDTIIGESNPKDWWTDFEVNVKGSYLMCRAFLRLVGLEKEATIVNVNTWGMLSTGPVGTSYPISKLALARLSEAIPSAYPKVSSMNYHPGMTVTEMAELHPQVLHFCKDTVELPAGTAVYLASPHAQFLSGRYMSANWDVDDLEAKKDEIIEKNLLKMDLKGEFGSAVATTPFSTTVLYPAKEGAKFDMDYLLSSHMPLAMKHWAQYGLKGYEITQYEPIGEQKPLYSAQVVMKWDRPESVEMAMRAPEAQIV
ncbi:NAD(P)-binding protein [Mytilinidion resinicola]|uniref:NAD(P)-binding protein n=1 Tax=Mytilinidion resinicola TaxID=574789 RepID=A0A6A6Z6E6_9PEZI|nr:NAD(P)-binding protein [Mytilinidion resinicola]KAF2815864.1 NAD(P)-binding protein [Mytilinidion resinicola]